MSRAHRAWRAGFTRRWHSNPDLSDTTDYVAGHQGRVAILVSVLEPDASRALLLAAITHDQGETAAGDLPAPIKRDMVNVAAQLDAVERAEIAAQFGDLPDLTEREKRLLKLCDWLDAWLWAMRFARHLYARADWQAQLTRMKAAAGFLGLYEEVCALVDAEIVR